MLLRTGRQGIQLQPDGFLFLPPTCISEKRAGCSFSPRMCPAQGSSRVRASRIHKRSIIQNFHSGDVQGTAYSPLLTLEEILAHPSPVPCNTLKPPPLFTSFSPWHKPVWPPVSHSSRRKEESGRISALIRNAEGEKDGRWLGGGRGKGKEAERDGGRLEGKKLERKISSQKEICPLFV